MGVSTCSVDLDNPDADEIAILAESALLVEFPVK